jgi:hypothetical protein
LPFTLIPSGVYVKINSTAASAMPNQLSSRNVDGGSFAITTIPTSPTPRKITCRLT